MLEKAKNYYFEHKLLINLLVCVGLIFLSAFWFPFMYLLLAFLLVSYWTLDVGEVMCLTMFLMMFSGMILLFVISAVYTFFVILVKYLIDLKHKKAVVLKWPLIITTAISVVFMLIFYKTDVYSVFQGLLIVLLLYFLYVAIAYKEKIDIYKCFSCLLFGMMVASVFGFIFYFIPSCSTLAYTNWKLEMVSLKEFMFHLDNGSFRLSLLSFHINHLAVIMLVAAAYAVNTFLTRRGKKTKDLVFLSLLLIFSMCIGALTLSKTFIVGAVIILLTGIVGGIVKYKLKSLKIIVPVLLLLGGLTAIFHEKVFQVFERFLGYDYSTVLFSITTGRNVIWAKYFNEMISKPLKLIFGAGLFTSEVVNIGPHSGYIFMFYRLGIVGSLCMCALAVSYLLALKKEYKINLLKTLPLIIFLIVSVIEACFDERFFFFVLSILFMFDKREQKEEQKQIENIENEI